MGLHMKKPNAALTIKNCCSKNCFGIEGYHASCCSVENRNYIIGPIKDAPRFLSAIRKKFNDDSIQFQDVFMEFEEGRVFSSQQVWQNPDNYPCLRVNPETRNKYCMFYNPFVKACSVYNIRPETCANYKCEHLREQLGLPLH